MIELKDITKVYGGKVKALDNISLSVPGGCIYGFLGPNGAGKTTAIKLITGIIKPDKGSVKVDGEDAMSIESKKNIGFVPDDPNVFLRLKGIEYLGFMADIYDVPTSEREARIKEFAQRFDMEKALSDKIQSYSHGMRQKIVIMGALIHQPKVWILDEPMTGLDPKSSFELKKMMAEHAEKGNTVFFSTHVLDVAEKVCDKLAVVNEGTILFSGNMEDLKESSSVSLEKMFLEMTENA